jgi:hypothetical protein
MKDREPYDEPTTGSGDPAHREGAAPDEPVTTGSGDPKHRPDPVEPAKGPGKA